MKLKNKTEWERSVALNKNDGYSHAVTLYAEAWANAMESQMKRGKKLEEIAEKTSEEVDQGITGFQYGCAVSILSLVWKYGEELRRWHNLKTQIKNEGERANKKGTVLNPAVIKIE